ncbi:MAG: ROK family transcriptional regulator [Bacteroidetes bacterium]|nr:ROK family transcriptional regulator [Bacteroidota bacterium]
MSISTNKPLSSRAAASIGLRGDTPVPGDWSRTALETTPSLTDRVLGLIWRERRISRADIARRTGLARSTVSEIVRDLLHTGLVAEVGTDRSSGGRRPIVLEFQDDAFGILGVDIGATHVAVAVTDLRGKVLAWREQLRPVRTDPEQTRALVHELCDACLAEWGRGNKRLVGIGLAVPSPVDPRHPDRISEVVLPAWRGHIGIEDLHLRYDVPVLVDNDANLGALAEGWWGAGRSVRDFTYIKVATGIGAGFILGGEIYRGSSGVAGEIGHVAIDPEGSSCVCGLRGCLVTLVGTAALIARAEELLPGYPDSVLAGKTLRIDTLERAAIEGDALAGRVVREAGEHLGIAVAGLLNLMNPEMVILGGGVTRVRELLLEPLRHVVRNRTLVTAVAATEIRISELGARAVAIGAATLVLSAALANPGLFPRTQITRTR